MKTCAGRAETGGSNVRCTDGLVNVGIGLVGICPLDVVVADVVPRSPGLVSKSSPTLLMMLSKSSSDLAVESRSEPSTYLLREGGSAMVLAVEFESFPRRRCADISESGPVFDEP